MGELFDILLQSALRACAAAAGVGITLALFRVRSAAVRHAAWASVLCAMLLMPALHRWLPAIQIPMRQAVVAPAAVADAFEAPPPAPASSAPVAVSKLPAPAPAQQPALRISWLDLAIAVYLLGVIASLVRLFAGYRAARAFERSCERTGDGFYQSARTVTPVTSGILRPRIVLPLDWPEWPQAKLRAVLAHETAHVRRRDNLTNALALVNRAAFWFHPLAGRLERKLAALAEHACDDQALRAAGGNCDYAALLLELARSAQRNGGRLVWQSGMAGAGPVEDRIARILAHRPERRMSLIRRIALAACCAVAILLAAACQRAALQPLRDNPENIARREKNRQTQLAYEQVRTMTKAQAEALEAQLEKNPEDMDAQRKLAMVHQWRIFSIFERPQAIASIRRQVFWFIERHPENPLASNLRISRAIDPEGYEQARKLWLKAAENPKATPEVLVNAAYFFVAEDNSQAERLLLEAHDNGDRLGRLYAGAIIGISNSTQNDVSTPANILFMSAARNKLAGTNNVAMLISAGNYLLYSGHSLYANQQRQHDDYGNDYRIDSDPLPLGKQYVERALQLDPQSVAAHRLMLYVRYAQHPLAWPRLAENLQYDAVAKLPDGERLLALAQLAEHQTGRADYFEYQKHNSGMAKQYWSNAGRYAQEALDLAGSQRENADYGTAVFSANMTLGVVAIHDGKRDDAARRLLAAGEAPSTEELAYSHQFGTYHLPSWLLKEGVREPVIRFLERFAQTDVAERKYLLDSAAQLRAGTKPSWYQY
jgi:beta-lactamase regulating signal transducer with metallopeptidase domain